MADSETDVTAEARELGVSTVDCPTCGKSLSMVEQPDGGTAYDSCTKCYPKATKAAVREQAEQQQAELVARETGTNVEKE